MQSFGNLVESLSINTFLVVLSELARRLFQQALNHLFSTMKLTSIKHNLVLLVDHLALELADLSLENLYFLCPRESLSRGC